MGKKKKKDSKKVSTKKQYPTNVEGRAKEAMSIQPPDENEFKKDNENNIDRFLRYRPRNTIKHDTIKAAARHKNNQ